ncbi:MAG: conjugal transfer protein TrbI [Nostocaceae cyanobacterium]|nr:conjugal transfer protein TrbI [Nostocaceae cyanobacterium]
MTRWHVWKSGTAAFLTIAMTTGAIVPMLTPTPANAQRLTQFRRNVAIPRNVTLPVEFEKDKIVVTPDETLPLTVKIASDIVEEGTRRILIPKDTEVVGELRPATRNGEKGSQFIAQELVYRDGRRQFIDANSQVITRTKKIKKGADTDQVLKNAAIGAGAAAVIALITGNRKIDILEPVGGAAAGALASILLGKKSKKVIVIEPQTGEMDITLNSNLVVTPR